MKSLFLLIIATLVTIMVDSCNQDTTNASVNKLAVNSVPEKAFSGDTINIYGKNFGTVAADITVIYDTMVFKPVSVSNTLIRVLAPKQKVRKVYKMLVIKGKDTVTIEKIIGMPEFDFAKVRKADISVRLHGTLFKNGQPNWTGHWSYDMTVTPCTGYGVGCPSNYTFTVCCNKSQPYVVYDESIVSGNVDNGLITYLSAHRDDSYNSPYNYVPDSYAKDFRLILKNAKYTDNGTSVEILYRGSAINTITPKVDYYDYNQTTVQNYPQPPTISSTRVTFTPSGNYTSDDYIRIVLYQ